MKIDKSEMVVRYHVVFSQEETMVLQEIGWLPHYLTKPAELTMTQDELEEYVKLGLLTKENVEEQLKEANAERYGVH